MHLAGRGTAYSIDLASIRLKSSGFDNLRIDHGRKAQARHNTHGIDAAQCGLAAVQPTRQP
jgi:hypothetical protein